MIECTKCKDTNDACVVARFWDECLEFCGCGLPGPMLGVFRDVIQTMYDAVRDEVDPQSWEHAYEKREALFKGNRAWEYLVYYVLHKADVTEHGGQVPGWLTPFGEVIFRAMVGHTDDELDAMIGKACVDLP